MESTVTYIIEFSIGYKDIVLFSLPLGVFAVCYVIIENALFCHKEMQRFNRDIYFTLKFKL